MRRIWLGILLLCSALPLLAQSGVKEDYDTCAKQSGDVAIAACNRAIQSGQLVAEDLAATYSNRGTEWLGKGEYDRALADYNEAIRLRPDYAEIFNNRGNVWRKKGEYDRAIADYNEAIRLRPDYAKAFNNRGNAWQDKGEYDLAITDYNQAIRLKPDFAAAFNGRGIVWYTKGEFDRAITDYNQAIRLEPDFALAFNNRADAWRTKGDYDRAIADYNEAIRLKMDYIHAGFGLGLVSFEQARWQDSMDYFSAVSLEPTNAYGALWLAMVQKRTGNTAYKYDLLERSSRFKQDWPMPIVSFYTDAITAQQLLDAAKNPDTRKQQRQLCEAYFFLGEWQLAAQQRKSAIPNLEMAMMVCPFSQSQYDAVRVELKRLQGK